MNENRAITGFSRGFFGFFGVMAALIVVAVLGLMCLALAARSARNTTLISAASASMRIAFDPAEACARAAAEVPAIFRVSGKLVAEAAAPSPGDQEHPILTCKAHDGRGPVLIDVRVNCPDLSGEGCVGVLGVLRNGKLLATR